MKIFTLTLLFGLLGYTISKPLDSKEATDALVDDWQNSAITTWPLQPAPLTAYTTYGLNLLTPAQLPQNEYKQKLQLSAATPTFPQTNTNFPHFLMPQYLSNQQQYFGYSSAFFNAPFGQYTYTAGQQYLPQLIAPFPSHTQTFPGNDERAIATTKRPKIKDREPTTRKPQVKLQFRPPKLEAKPEKFTQDVADFKNDAALLRAVEKINPEYVIEEIINVPGKHVYSTKPTEQKSTRSVIQQTNEQKQNQLVKKSNKGISGVKVEATGKTSTKGNIPEIPFGTYFLPYFSQQQQSGKKPAALILEPHSKAIVGNGGTAISTPISKAYLKRGVTTNVYFNPESVAIAGVGGKAHAQADLELDLIN